MFIIISNQIAKMCLLLILGFVLYKTKLIDHQGNKSISNLLLMVVTPFMIINSFQIDYSPELMKGLLIAMALSVLTHLVGILISQIMIRSKNAPDIGLERLCAVYSNCGFMGIPLVQSILGSEGVFFVTAYMVVFNLLVWTHGLMCMTGSFSLKQLRKGLTTPTVFGIITAIFLFVCQIRLPEVLADTVGYIAAMNTPLAMLVAGVSLAETDLFRALRNKRLYLVSLIKLLLIPLVMIGIFFLMPFPKTILCTVIVAAACPVGTTGTMFALRYNGNYKYASEMFACSTVMSLATIPLMVLIMETLYQL